MEHGGPLTTMSDEEMREEIARLRDNQQNLEALLSFEQVSPIEDLVETVMRQTKPLWQQIAHIAQITEHAPDVPEQLLRLVNFLEHMCCELDGYIDVSGDTFQTVEREAVFSNDVSMKVLSFANQKGGVGKTLISTNFAFAVSALVKGSRLLFIDNDKQGNASNWFDADFNHGTITNLLMGDATAKEVIQATRYPGIDLIAADMGLLAANTAIMREHYPEQVHILGKALEPVRDKYDLCIIDNAPDINGSILNALVATDDVIIVSFPDCDSLAGARQTLRQIELLKSVNPHISLRGLLFNGLSHYPPTSAVIEELRREKLPIFKTKIHYAGKLARNHLQEARQERRAIFERNPGCQMARDIYAYTREMLGLRFAGYQGFRITEGDCP